MKKIKQSEFRFLKQEIDEVFESKIISVEQRDQILANYQVTQGLNFTRVLLIIGSILVGLGIMSFIASNWQHINKLSKLAIILGFMATSFGASYYLEDKYIKTSNALLYLSYLIYGGGIFLVGQIFNYGGEFSSAFLLWVIGLVPAILILKDKLIYVFASILTFIYIVSSFNKNIMIESIAIITILYFANRYFSYSKLMTFLTNILSLMLVLQTLDYYSIKEPYVQIIFLVIGLGFFYIKNFLNSSMFKIQGILLIGLSGFSLSFEWPWRNIIEYPNNIAIAVGIVLMLYMLSLVKRGLITPLVIICLMILRYYFDTFYDFMPKSMFFLTGGIILIGFGHYFERLRRRQGGEKDE